MNKKINIEIGSEIGELEAVIIHTPGPEVENMTPANAERALYSDILNLSVAKKEYSALEEVLNMFTRVLKVKDLLAETLSNTRVKETLVKRICSNENIPETCKYLLDKPKEELARLLIEGVVMQKNTLTRFLSKERYSLPPLHNFFFTRDAAIPMIDGVFISKMANKIRERESIIMETIFDFSGIFNTKTHNATHSDPAATIEGGDVLVVRDDILIIGNGARTSSKGIDLVLELFCNKKEGKRHIIVQELPGSPESFIHLDMVFTLLDTDSCMVYEPVIFKTNKYQAVQITIDNGKVSCIREERNIPEALSGLGIDLKPIYCGGKSDLWIQEREQWHSGANFFAIAPGKVIGYGRNTYTLDEMSKNGFEVIKASDIISGKADPRQNQKVLISLDGSELPRGGGGARCMTMPLRRKPVVWK
ncbi:MAG: arginine deiminase family protein [Bacteroidales bacterium]